MTVLEGKDHPFIYSPHPLSNKLLMFANYKCVSYLFSIPCSVTITPLVTQPSPQSRAPFLSFMMDILPLQKDKGSTRHEEQMLCEEIFGSGVGEASDESLLRADRGICSRLSFPVYKVNNKSPFRRKVLVQSMKHLLTKSLQLHWEKRICCCNLPPFLKGNVTPALSVIMGWGLPWKPRHISASFRLCL